MIQQNLRGFCATKAALPARGLYLHASAVVANGGVVLFLGHSTAGKSTIAHLLSPLCPVLADDTVLVQEGESGQWLVTDGKHRLTASPPTANHPRVTQCRATDSPLTTDDSRSTIPPSHRPTGIPLHACVRIHKGPALRHEPMAPIDLAQCLMDAVMEVDVQRKCGRLDPKNAATAPDAIAAARTMRGHWFHLAAEMARHCPGRHLWFPPDADPHALVAAIGWR